MPEKEQVRQQKKGRTNMSKGRFEPRRLGVHPPETLMNAVTKLEECDYKDDPNLTGLQKVAQWQRAGRLLPPRTALHI